MANLLFQSEKSQSTQHYKVTIFTPTFNRKSTIPRTYESLKQLKCNNSSNFEWIIVDDGSNDNTEKLGELWCKENIIPIRYFKLHIPADTRSAFPVISVQSPVSIQCCWQS